jgi:hypothetical protein
VKDAYPEKQVAHIDAFFFSGKTPGFQNTFGGKEVEQYWA